MGASLIQCFSHSAIGATKTAFALRSPSTLRRAILQGEFKSHRWPSRSQVNKISFSGVRERPGWTCGRPPGDCSLYRDDQIRAVLRLGLWKLIPPRTVKACVLRPHPKASRSPVPLHPRQATRDPAVHGSNDFDYTYARYCRRQLDAWRPHHHHRRCDRAVYSRLCRR
ncbi:hypothetical protein B0H12DRAFT_689615 [Mycena haematopus]|nr:hypothetical protein B0H12DRAFT_689615 [Mycena haematopus]